MSRCWYRPGCSFVPSGRGCLLWRAALRNFPPIAVMCLIGRLKTPNQTRPLRRKLPLSFGSRSRQQLRLWLQKNVLPLLAGNNAAPPLTGVAVIDPGHGGEDAGTRSVIGRGYEKDYTLDWARRLAGLLESNGWTVLLTRTNDADLSLSNRVAFTELHHADIFISLHFNSSAPDETQY